MPGAPVEFWYEFASPYSYLAAARIERLAAAAALQIAWRPFLLGPILAQRAHDPSPFQNPTPAQRRYRWRDVQRLCAAEALPLNLPSTYPRNGLLAARVALIAIAEGWGPSFTRAVYHANFAEDRDIAAQAVIADVIAALGRDPAPRWRRRKAHRTKPGSKRKARRRFAAASLARRAFWQATSCSGATTGSRRRSPGRSHRSTYHPWRRAARDNARLAHRAKVLVLVLFL